MRALPDFESRHPEPSCSGRPKLADLKLRCLSYDLETELHFDLRENRKFE